MVFHPITYFIEEIHLKNLMVSILFFVMKAFHPAIITGSLKSVIQILSKISLIECISRIHDLRHSSCDCDFL